MTKNINNINLDDINVNNIFDYDESENIDIIKKNTLGEVFTPIKLCFIILDLLPHNIWYNPYLKWCEPSAGSGYFALSIYVRLMEGLKKWEPNDKKRSKHIIKNMLFMVEYNQTNCKKLKKLFGSDANIVCDDFLQYVTKKEMYFDIIIGNPPFQDNYGLTDFGKKILGGKTKLYEKIFIKAYNCLNKNGYLAFITPDNIFSGMSESYNLLVNNHTKYIYFGLKEWFPTIQHDMCYFILHKGAKGITKIKNNNLCTNDSIELQLIQRPVNPIKCWTHKNENLINKYITTERNTAIYNRGKNVSSYKGSKYKLIYSPNKLLSTNNEEKAIGLGIKKAIIFFISPKCEFKMDYTGKYGVGPNTFYIPFKTLSEGKKLEKFLKSDEYQTLVSSTRVSRQYIRIALIEYLNLDKIIKSKSNSKNITKKINIRQKQHTRKNKY